MGIDSLPAPKKVLMLLGSRRCVPPTEAANTISWLLQSFVENASCMDVRIISQWHDSLRQADYDHDRYLHVMPKQEERLKKIIALLPYRIRKWLFGIADTKVIAYYLGQALLVRRIKPDLVIAHVAYPLFRISRFLNPNYRHIYYFHSSNLADFPIHFIRDLYRHANGLVAICHIALDEIQEKYGLLPMPSAAIHNGVDTSLFNTAIAARERLEARKKYHIAENATVLLYAGRIHPTKGVDKIFEAFLALREQYPSLVLLIAGDEKFERSPDLAFGRQFRQDVQKHGQGAVYFAGWLPYSQLVQAYAAADMGVLASLEIEGNSMFLLETMACGLPVVSTAVGGVPEIVSHGVSGFLVDPNQDITTGLAEALGKLLTNPSLRLRMGRQAAQRVTEHFSAPTMVKNFEHFLDVNHLI